ncbi:MAG TPA: hypothetical protein VNT99_10395 [Methylomirabilota bacterium]|nr:hypothetical protein [Methylomirabilota bacterium]
MSPARFICLCLALIALPLSADQLRRAPDEPELRYWLANMTTHRYSLDEMPDVLGLGTNEIAAALRRFDIRSLRSTNSLLVIPYPGARHPRIGFLDGAIDPQRETKISVFTPWDSSSYVVVDVPEAIFSNLGLTYLAHTHVPTIWTEKKIQLPQLEWKRHADGSLESERVLPNNIAFGVKVTPTTNAVLMELWLRNGTDKLLTGMRVQNCVMLKAAAGFNQQTNANKILAKPFIACGSPDSQRWIITAWEPCQRVWANPPVPCLHSDPQIPDCPPGETRRVRGWLSFYEGSDVWAEFKRIEKLGWSR